MPRPPREDYEGAWHHVMNRGAAHSPVLAMDEDRKLFLECLVEGASRYGMQIHAYCLMKTHYHLLMLSSTGKLSETMRFLSGRFTKLKNLREARDGAVFRGRFHSVGIETNPHLMQASRYIHLNPVEAGIVRRAQDWPWSSAAAYLAKVEPPGWLCTRPILEMTGGPDPRLSYAAYLNSGIDQPTLEFYARMQIT